MMEMLFVPRARRLRFALYGCISTYVMSRKEFILSKQVLRSGTSIGANVSEALRGQSRADFYAKMNIALKEASETEYWLELLHESGYIEKSVFASIYADNQELLRILVAITKTQKGAN